MPKKTGRELLKEALRRKGLTARQTALLLGCSGSAVTNWTAGIRLPSRRMAAALERALGVPSDAWQIDALAREAA